MVFKRPRLWIVDPGQVVTSGDACQEQRELLHRRLALSVDDRGASRRGHERPSLDKDRSMTDGRRTILAVSSAITAAVLLDGCLIGILLDCVSERS